MAVNIDDILRITCNFRFDALDEYVNVYHFEWAGVDGLSDDLAMDQVAADLDAGYDEVNDDVSDKVAFVDIQGQNITKNTLLPTKTWPTMTIGLATGDVLPTQVAANVYFRTQRPLTRASKFLPPYTQDATNPTGGLTTVALARVQSFGDLAVLGFTVVVNHLTYGAYNAALERFTPVTAAVVPTKYRTQRRRRVGVGS